MENNYKHTYSVATKLHSAESRGLLLLASLFFFFWVKVGGLHLKCNPLTNQQLSVKDCHMCHKKIKGRQDFYISSFYAYATTDLKIINSFLLQSVSYNDYLTL